MRKVKGKVELRYYEIPQDEFLLVLQGDCWKRQYGSKDGLMHFHNLMEIGICRGGEGEMQMEQECFPYKPGMITVIPANYPHNTISTENTESYWEYLFIDVEKILQFMYPDDLLFQQKMLETINHKAWFGYQTEVTELSTLTEMILEESRRKRDSLYRESIRGMTLALLIQVSRIYLDPVSLSDSIRQKRGGFEQVRPALDYIQSNYATPMKISEIASVCHISESHFRRLFEENIGMTPVEYLNQVRVRKACDLIKKTGNSMEEIAVKVGFTTTSTFNRNFKRITGTSPYQWKKQPDNYESRLSQCSILIEKGW